MPTEFTGARSIGVAAVNGPNTTAELGPATIASAGGLSEIASARITMFPAEPVPVLVMFAKFVNVPPAATPIATPPPIAVTSSKILTLPEVVASLTLPAEATIPDDVRDTSKIGPRISTAKARSFTNSNDVPAVPDTAVTELLLFRVTPPPVFAISPEALTEPVVSLTLPAVATSAAGCGGGC